MRKIGIDLVLAVLLVAMHSNVASAQDMLPTDTEAGTPSFSTAISLAPGVSLDLPTGNINLDIPVRTKTGKIPFSYDLITNSHVFWIPALGCGNPCTTYQWSSTIPLAGFQGASSIPVMQPYIVSSGVCWNQWPYQIYQSGFTPCIPSPAMTAGYQYTWNNGAQPTTCAWYFADIRGTTHFFPTVPVILNQQGAAECPFAGVYPNGAVAIDGSGYQIVVLSNNPLCFSGCGEIVLPNGSTGTYTLTLYSCGQRPPENGSYTFSDSDDVSITDTWNWQNGNYCNGGSTSMGQRVDTFTDTMTSPAIPLVTATIADLYDSPIKSTQSTYTYTDGETIPQIQQFTVKYTPASVQTAFGCPNVQEVQSLYNTSDLPTEIDRPDGSRYTFAYEQTPGNPSAVTGRLASVTLPTGGSLQFTYVNTNGHYGIDCNSGVVPQLKVKTNDGNGNVGTWTYYNTNTSSGPTHFSAAIVDPNNNETVHYFSGTTNGVGSTSPPGAVFPTEVESYQGLQSGGTLLAGSLVCYNNNFTNCQAPSAPVAYPIFQKDVYKFPVINGVIQTQNPSLVETKFDYNSNTGVTFGNVISVSKWDFGATLPPSNNTASTTTIAYGTWNGSACAPTATYIVNTPCEIQVGNLVGGSLTNLTRHERNVYDSNGHRLETYDYAGYPIVPPGKAWQPSTYYSLDGVVIASSNEGGDLWQVTVPGAGGSTPPFSSGHLVGYQVQDNQVTWTLIQTAASLTWQPNTQYNPGQKVNGNVVGQYVVAAANGTNYLYKLEPTTLPTTIEQSGSVPNTSSGDYVDLYFFDTSLNSNPGGWTYDGYNYTTSNLANYAKLHLNGATTNSMLFNIPGASDPDQQPIYYFQLDQAGDIVATTQISVPNNNYIGNNHYSMVALFSLNIPVPGRYTITISNDDGMLFGIDKGATYVSGPNQTYQSLTAMNSYPIIGGIDINGNHGSNSYVVTFPNATTYDVEVDYYQWETEQDLSFQIGPTGSPEVFAPIPIAIGTFPQSLPTPPTWPSWTTSQSPAYPTVTEQGTYQSPFGQYSPTGGGLTWANHGPASDFTWQANMSFTLPNTTIVDPTGSKEAPYRSGYSGTTIPGFALQTNGLSTDGPTLTWINQGGAAGLITQYGYNASGVLDQVTDPAGNITSYSNFGCGGLLPQTTTLPPNAAGNQLISNSTWNCNTAITTAFTDANGNTQAWTYADPLIRPTLYVDQVGTQTTTSYTTNTVENTTNFSGGGTTIASAGPNAPRTGTCTGPFQGFTCVTSSPLGSWGTPQNVGSTTSAATVSTDQYDISQNIVSTSVSVLDPAHPILTVTMANAFPPGTPFGVGSWVQVQGTQEVAVNSNQYQYQVLTMTGAMFTAAVCSTGESNCPSIPEYSNNNDTGYVRFNNYFSWSLNATNFAFLIPTSSLVSGVVVTANVVTSCPSGNCKTGNANGHAAPYVSIRLLNNSIPVGAPKFVSVPVNGTTPVSLGNQNDIWGASSITGNVVNNANFGVAISVVQPDLNLGPDAEINWSVNSVTVTLVYQAGSTTNSTNDVIKYLDGFGRTYLTQTSEGIGSPNWDTVENDYNTLGQVVRSTLPFVSTKGAKSSTAPGTTYQYDAVGRTTLVTDSETPPGTIAYAYPGQDVLTTLSPAPANENTKSKQYEYDGLGRLKSVCEVTVGYGIWPGLPCGQAYSASGYLTAYAYDSSNRLINVVGNSTAAPDSPGITATEITSGTNTNVLTVNTTSNNFFIGAPITLSGTNESYLNGLTVVVASVSSMQFTANVSFSPYNCDGGPCPDKGNATFPTQQSRSFVYDVLGRITTQNDVESGTSTFVYDIATSPCPAYSSFGDLAQKTDAVGNVICFTYDALHRVISMNTVAGAYAPNTPGKFYVYDSASVTDPSGQGGFVLATTLNGAGQVAAAYTCSGLCATSGTTPGTPPFLSTEVFSYDSLQRPTTLYQSPVANYPFMIMSENYFPNGQINSLGLTTQNGGGYPGTSTFFYSVDGMGRVSSLTSYINSVSHLVASVESYQPATSLPTLISYYDGDSDSYQYDQNTLRMLTYNFTIPGSNGGTWGGVLTWNPNGSLQQLALSNTVPKTNMPPFPTCTYQYDDLLRMNSEQCGSNNYSQSALAYDPFGNPSNTTPGGDKTFYSPMTFNPQSNQIASFVGCGLNQNCTGPYHDADGNQLLPLYSGGASFAWDAFGNWWGFGGQQPSQQYGYDAFDRPVRDGFLYGGNPMFYRPDGGFFFNTGNANFSWYWALQHMRLPLPGGSDVELIQNCFSSTGYCDDPKNPYPYVYAIRHADFHGSHVFGSCADQSAEDPTCTYNTYYFGHITDAFGNVEQTVNCGFGCNSNEEPGSFDAALWDLSGNTGYLLFPTRSYIQSETRFMHPEEHANVNLSDPQSWNSYGYTRNNPLSFRDPLGLYTEDCPPGDYGGDCSGPPDEGGGIGIGGIGWGGGSSNPSSNPPSSPGGAPPWQEWGNSPPWLTNPPSLAVLLGLPYGTCDFGVCNPVGYGLTSPVFGSGTIESPYVIYVDVLDFLFVAADIATISAYHPSIATCLGQAAISAGEDLLGVSMLPGSDQDNWQWSSDKFGFVYTGAGEVMDSSVGLDAVEKTAGFVEGTPAAQAEIRLFLRSEGVKVSMKHVAKDAATVGKWAGRAGKVLAAYSAYQRYQKCRGD